MASESDRPGLVERLDRGAVICAEGYVFELERRGYLQAGAFVPEVVLEHPEVVAQLHRDFVHAGSEVVEALTYYAHREKLRVIGREGELEALNRQALAIAKEVAAETGTLLAGNISNTNAFIDGDADSARAVRAMFEEQVAWAVDAGVDFVIAETYSWGQEALMGARGDQGDRAPGRGHDGRPSRSAHVRGLELPGGLPPARGCRRRRRRAELHPRPENDDARASRDPGGGLLPRRGTACALPDDRGGADLLRLDGSWLRLHPRGASLPDRARALHVQPLRDCRVGGARPTTSASTTSACAAARGRTTSAPLPRRSAGRRRRAGTPPTCRSTRSSEPTRTSRRSTGRISSGGSRVAPALAGPALRSVC